MSGRSKDSASSGILEEILDTLSRNRPVRKKLPGWGRLHIDRRLPFLCLYRRPQDRPDPGTERLLLGEASYLLAKEEEEGLKELIREIASFGAKIFGSFLILELRAGPDAEEAPTFRIEAPKRQAPSALLENLETALLDVRMEGRETSVDLRFGDLERKSPLDERELADLGAMMLGLEVSPVYRDEKTGVLFPFELRQLHHGLARALKQAFYRFAHDYTSHRPAHYQELGRRAMTEAVGEADRRLAELSGRFDLLLHVTPVNGEAAWKEFEESGFEAEPEFLYRPRSVDPALAKRQLYAVALEDIEDPTLADVFASKRLELDRQLTMIEDRGTRRFLRGSQLLYGEIEGWLLAMARSLLESLPPRPPGEGGSRTLDALSFARRAEEELVLYRQQDPSLAARVELRDDVSGLMVCRGNLLIGKDAKVPEERVGAALAHEVGTHVLTYHNGLNQPLKQLYAGMGGYEALQEGIAVLSEYLVGGLNRGRLRLLAGRVVAASAVSEGADFVETFRTLAEDSGFAPYTAFLSAMRVHRGGGFTKDAIYLKGLVDLLGHLAGRGDLELLFLGKISLDDLPLMEELRWRRVLSPERLRPRHLDGADAAARLAKVRSGIALVDLLEAKLR